jgi:hypothetical protein
MMPVTGARTVQGQARTPPVWPGSIPRISHGQQHQTASAGIWLHVAETSQGRRSVPELVFLLVAGVGFEPT